MTGVEDGEERQTQEANTPPPASEGGAWRAIPRVAWLTLGVSVVFFVTVGLVMYFKPGSTAEPSGEPALDVFAAGPILDFEAGEMTLFENEHFFLVRLEDGGLLALYDLGAHIQAQVADGDLEALRCRAVLREDEEMQGWLAAAAPPEGFESRGIWEECDGVAWDATGQQIWGPESGSLDRFTVEIVDGIIRVNLGERLCTNLASPEAPCIVTQ